MLALVSCKALDPEPEPQSKCAGVEIIRYRDAANIRSFSNVLVGTKREYRYREPVSGICTAEHIFVSADINVVDSVDLSVDEETVVSTAGGSGLTFPLVRAFIQNFPGRIHYETLPGTGFLINNVYPSPAPGEIVAGVNVRFPSLGTAARDSVFFRNHISNFNVTIKYWQQ